MIIVDFIRDFLTALAPVVQGLRGRRLSREKLTGLVAVLLAAGAALGWWDPDPELAAYVAGALFALYKIFERDRLGS